MINIRNRSLLDIFIEEHASVYANCLKNSIFICIQHCIKTIIPQFEAIINMGVNPKSIFLLGKPYSNDPAAINILRSLEIHCFEPAKSYKSGYFQSTFSLEIKSLVDNALAYADKKKSSRIFLLDDGGQLVKAVSCRRYKIYQFVGVEQTSRGITEINKLPKLEFPMISVARSAAKKFLEAPIITRKIFERLDNMLSTLSQKKVGVIGVGCIGAEAIKILKKRQIDYIAMDAEYEKLLSIPACSRRKISSSVFNDCDVILGCTGHDISINVPMECFFNTDKILVSCSSGDIEFNNLLRYIGKGLKRSPRNIHDDIVYYSSMSSCLTIKKGGFPFNFDYNYTGERFEDIQLTRCLMLAAIVQLCVYQKQKTILPNQVISLDEDFQHFIIREWLTLKQNQPGSQPSKFSTLPFISLNSEGLRVSV